MPQQEEAFLKAHYQPYCKSAQRERLSSRNTLFALRVDLRLLTKSPEPENIRFGQPMARAMGCAAVAQCGFAPKARENANEHVNVSQQFWKLGPDPESFQCSDGQLIIAAVVITAEV